MIIYLIKSEVINLKAKHIQSEIEAIHYWDARVLQMDTNYKCQLIYVQKRSLNCV